MKRFLSQRKQIILNVNINWMQITADKVLNFNVDTFTFSFIPHKEKNSTLGISNDVLVRRNITYPILSSSTWRILSARSKTFLMISFSLSVISVFLPVFLAGPLEWKDHPEFSLKMRWKKPSLTMYFNLVHLSISLLLISFQKLTTLQRKLIKPCNLKEDKESSPIENGTINQKKKQCTNSKFSKDLGHLVRVFLKNFFKTFLGRKHIVFSWPNKAFCTIDHLRVSQNQTGNTHRKSRKRW